MKKLNEKQIKRNLAFTVFMILFILSFFIFNPAWSEDHDQEKYCWISGENFHDFKDAISKQCKTGDLIWVVSKGGTINGWNIEQRLANTAVSSLKLLPGREMTEAIICNAY